MNISRDPSNATLYLERAYRERLDGHLDRALADLDRAAAIAPEDLRVAAERGLVLAALGCDVEAEAELTRFLQRGPPTAPVLAEWARIHARAGRDDAALLGFDAAIALRPDPDLYLERGVLLEKLGRLDDAAAGYRQGLARLSGAVALRSALLRVETSRGKWEDALVLVDEEIRRAPVKTRGYLLKAEILQAAALPAEARAAMDLALAEADRVVERSPTGLHLYGRARVRLAMGRVEGARADLEDAIRRSPRFAEARGLLATLPPSPRAGGYAP